jgi:mono/diheme cytochrome c family protein
MSRKARAAILGVTAIFAYGAALPTTFAQSTAVTPVATGWSGGNPDQGRQLFANNGCGWCHEDGGRRAGRGPQLMDTQRSDDFIANRIRHGFPGHMPAFGSSLQDPQIRDLIAFIRSIKPAGS